MRKFLLFSFLFISLQLGALEFGSKFCSCDKEFWKAVVFRDEEKVQSQMKWKSKSVCIDDAVNYYLLKSYLAYKSQNFSEIEENFETISLLLDFYVMQSNTEMKIK